ncbi:hypothetical protein EYC98_03815 [Halieaceae bacterium IMCC14734]|uniref:DUF4760 domain-containing protein n=1 Tax=Candidatus Litorirhabdus singularis TaxID=2518993 RepID=A0ABT3TCG3_9GAMM|nr:hypothetical protein [Candidatus Litorirhabdus singularis]MCX2979988.1 hypothetical protein [Candidatus Litorirhabdus singularis]
MNWEAIGALADSVGVIVVIVTLIYLTIQLRQNTKAIKHSTDRGVFDDANKWMFTLIENPEIAELYVSGMQDEKLTSSEKLRFSLLLNTLFVHWNHAFETGAFEIVNNSQIKGVLSRPGGAAYWNRTLVSESISLSDGFIAHVNALDNELKRVES